MTNILRYEIPLVVSVLVSRVGEEHQKMLANTINLGIYIYFKSIDFIGVTLLIKQKHEITSLQQCSFYSKSVHFLKKEVHSMM